jgi:predicted N-acyltransferase
MLCVVLSKHPLESVGMQCNDLLLCKFRQHRRVVPTRFLTQSRLEKIDTGEKKIDRLFKKYLNALIALFTQPKLTKGYFTCVFYQMMMMMILLSQP